jgi:hypothetical protein
MEGSDALAFFRHATRCVAKKKHFKVARYEDDARAQRAAR